MQPELSAGPYWGNATYYPPLNGFPAPAGLPAPAQLTIDLTVTIIPPQCGQCAERASCAYSYGGVDSYYACESHDPTRQPGWLAAAPPWCFTYRTLPPLAVPHTTGHLAGAWPGGLG